MIHKMKKVRCVFGFACGVVVGKPIILIFAEGAKDSTEKKIS